MKEALYAPLLNIDLSTNGMLMCLIETRSTMNHAAGNPTPMVNRPCTRNVHAMPTLRTSASSATAMTVAPIPPPIFTSPNARPRWPLKYCTGNELVIVYAMLEPIPAATPMVRNKPGTLDVHHPALIRLVPIIAMPVMDVTREPKRRENRVLAVLNMTPHARFREPMKAVVEVDVEESVDERRDAWMTPQQLIWAVIQNVRHEAAATTVQPYPPSGIAVVLKSVVS